jgi:hypothetical protein
MTYYAGSWEYGGGNGMQVAMDVTWSSVSHSSTSVTATVKFYTDNQYPYSDNQTLNISSNLGSDYSFNNNDGTSEVYRTTRTYTYTYPSGSYGSSPGSVTFSATISGAYNGVTPTVSESIAIPARPAAAPSAPTLTATAVSSSEIDLSWTAPSNGGSAITSYTVQWSSNGSTWYGLTTTDDTVRTYKHTGIAKYTLRYYRVAAVNSVGTGSWSAVDTAQTFPTAPSTPANFTATPDINSVYLTWDSSTDWGGLAPGGYDVYRDNVKIVSLGASYTEFTDTGVAPATSYSYKITAGNWYGNSAPSTITTTTIGGVLHVWNGTSYVSVLPKVWNGSTYVEAQARLWNGTEWKYGI